MATELSNMDRLIGHFVEGELVECGNCDWWHQDHPEAHVGVCTAVKTTGLHDLARLGVKFPGDVANLVTRHDFYCSLWEERTDDDTK